MISNLSFAVYFSLFAAALSTTSVIYQAYTLSSLQKVVFALRQDEDKALIAMGYFPAYQFLISKGIEPETARERLQSLFKKEKVEPQLTGTRARNRDFSLGQVLPNPYDSVIPATANPKSYQIKPEEALKSLSERIADMTQALDKTEGEARKQLEETISRYESRKVGLERILEAKAKIQAKQDPK